MREVTAPIIAALDVLMAVFIPSPLFLASPVDCNQFALTVAISVSISAFNSLTLSPALAAAFLRPRPHVHFLPFRLFNGVRLACECLCQQHATLIRLRWIMLGLLAAGVAATYLVSIRIPSTFLPVEDLGYFFAVISSLMARRSAPTRRQ
jgi:HAE1 family hydrophobic/amphiphilic exporter-1